MPQFGSRFNHDSRRNGLRVLVLGALLVPGLAACGPAPQPPGGLDLSNAPAVADSVVDPETEIVDTESLEAHILANGIPLRFDAETAIDYLPGPKARIYGIEGSSDSLEVHVYPSLEEAEVAAGCIQPDPHWITDLEDPDEPYYVQWNGTPHAYWQNNVLVIYVGEDARILEVLERGLGEKHAGG